MKPQAMSISSRENNFDLLRLFAATQVMVGHAFVHLKVPMPGWWSLFEHFPGVPIFFVISGFLISASWERSRTPQAYVEARALRIFPALWCCIALTILVFGWMGVDFLRRETFPWAAAQMGGLIYTPAFLRNFGFGSYNGALWTIPVELQFYLLVPLVYLLSGRSRLSRWRLSAVLAVFVCVHLLVRAKFPNMGTDSSQQESPVEKLVRYSFLPYFYLFVAGMWMQRLQVQNSAWIRNQGILWLAIYLAAAYLIPASPITSAGLGLLLGICVIAIAYTSPTLARKLLRGNDISYGVYIFHGLLINVMVESAIRNPPAIGLILLCAATYLTAWLSWTWIEKPCLALKGRFFGGSAARSDLRPVSP